MAIDTGIVTDAVMDLDHRGLSLGRPLAPYVAGGPDFYQWCQGRVDVDRIERTHDPSRLSAIPPLVAVNTALQVDLDGQVNVEAVGGSAVAGIGGQPDYAAAAARSVGGLSVVALPTTHAGHPTLVERLSAPTTTPPMTWTSWPRNPGWQICGASTGPSGGAPSPRCGTEWAGADHGGPLQWLFR